MLGSDFRPDPGAGPGRAGGPGGRARACLPAAGSGEAAEEAGCAQKPPVAPPPAPAAPARPPAREARPDPSEPPVHRMGNQAGKREPGFEKIGKVGGTSREDGEKRRAHGLDRNTSEDSDVFGETDVERNNGGPSQGAAAADSRRAEGPKNAWPHASPAEPGGRPHLTRLFSRDAPGREDNTFKERPSESDELRSIPEDSAAQGDAMAQKRPSQRSKYLASASTMDHVRHGFLPRRQDTGILDSLGRFLSGGRAVPKRGSGKDTHHAARSTHYGSLPQKSQHGRAQDENPVVQFFKNIVTPRTPPPSQGKGRGLSFSRFSWGAEGQKPGFGYGGRASTAHKGFKAQDAQTTLSRIFKLGGRDSRSGSPMARR